MSSLFFESDEVGELTTHLNFPFSLIVGLINFNALNRVL